MKDINLLNGTVRIQIPKGQGLINMEKLKAITIRAILRGSKKDCIKEFILFNQSMEWQ